MLFATFLRVALDTSESGPTLPDSECNQGALSSPSVNPEWNFRLKYTVYKAPDEHKPVGESKLEKK